MFREDLSAFFSLGDFAETVSVDGRFFSAIFDATYIDPLGTTSARSMLTCRDEDIRGVVRGAPAVVRGLNYIVRGIEPDGTGVTALMLERA